MKGNERTQMKSGLPRRSLTVDQGTLGYGQGRTWPPFKTLPFIYLTFWLYDRWDLNSLTWNGICTPLQWKCRVLTTGPPGKFSDPSFLFGLSIFLGFMFWSVLLLELYLNLWMRNDYVSRNSWSKNCLWFKGKGFYESLKVRFRHLVRRLCYCF